MYITWIFGNGLDIGLGMNTSYLDFYQYLEQNPPKEENMIFEMYKEDTKKGLIKEWSDYETKLGDITKNISIDLKEKFIEDKVNIDILLREYLTNINNSVNISDEDYLFLAKQTIIGFCDKMPTMETDLIGRILASRTNEVYHIQMISFNYTDIIEQMYLSSKQDMSGMQILNKYPARSILLTDTLYIHGTIHNNEMMIGVNDESQINNEELAKDIEIQNALIKERLQVLSRQSKYRNFELYINRSSLIMVYGSSIGDTDKKYWKTIKNKLLKKEALLIIFYYDEEYEDSHITLYAKEIDKVKNIFYETSDASDSEKEVLNNQILVVVNSFIFSLSKEDKPSS